MATKGKKSVNTATPKNTNGANFADVRYTTEDKDAFSKWLETTGAVLEDALEALTRDAYRVTLKTDYNNNCQMCTVTQQEEHKHKNSGIILTVRASTNANAILLAAWTIFEMYRSEPLPLQSFSGDFWI